MPWEAFLRACGRAGRRRDFRYPKTLSAALRTISIAKQMRKLGITLILVIASIFVAMKGRTAWYAITLGGAGHDMTSSHRNRRFCLRAGSADSGAR
jgi:hypothetical protein